MFPTGQTSIFSVINLVSVQVLSIKAIVLQADRFHRPGLEARELVNELTKPDHEIITKKYLGTLAPSMPSFVNDSTCCVDLRRWKFRVFRANA